MPVDLRLLVDLPQLPALGQVPVEPGPIKVLPPEAAPPNVREARRAVGVTNDPPILDPVAYDYVFVGGGLAGATGAAKLTNLFAEIETLRAKGFKVAVLEGGVDKPDEKTVIPVEHGLASESPNVLADPDRKGAGTGYMVSHYPADQAGRDDKASEAGKVWKPRGEGYGGSARMNANVFVRVDDVDWDSIASATGDPAFRAQNMKKFFVELTKAEYRPVLRFLHGVGETIGWEALKNRGSHGFEGDLEITTADPRLLTEDPQVKALAIKGLLWATTHVGTPMDRLKRLTAMFDPNDDRTQGTEGAVLMPTTITKDGKRNGARDILLRAKEKHGETLTLKDGVRVHSVILDDENRCRGLRYFDKDGRPHELKVNREVILAAGAFETPCILNRSGIGAAEDLERLRGAGIEPKVVLEGVGRNQGDREEIGMTFRLKKPLALLEKLKLPVDHDDPVYKRWAAGQGGPLATNGAFFSMQVKSDPKLDAPDLFIFAVPGRFNGYWLGPDNKVETKPGTPKVGYAEEAGARTDEITFLVLNANKGVNHGTVKVDPDNIMGHPIIDHHFEAHQNNAALLHGVKTVRQLVADKFKDLVAEELWPGPGASTDQQIMAQIDSQKWGHHPRGGAQIGHPNAESTVVDSDFKVLGTTGLRAIDASVTPDQIGTFIASGLYQLAKLAGQKIAAEAEQGPRPAAKENWLSIRLQPKPEKLEDARKLTKTQAEAAQGEGLISEAQLARLTDGTVSRVDIDVAWAAIEAALGSSSGIGSDRHTVAHNLLIAVESQLALQSPARTTMETVGDRVRTTLGGG